MHVPLMMFSLRRDQRHRPELKLSRQYREVARLRKLLAGGQLLLALDFAAKVIEVLTQPMPLVFDGAAGKREHIPVFLAVTRSDTWLVDVGPVEPIAEKGWESFAAGKPAERRRGAAFPGACGHQRAPQRLPPHPAWPALFLQ